MFNPRVKSSATSTPPATSAHEPSRQATAGPARQPTTTSGEIPAGLPQARRSPGGAAAPQHRPPSRAPEARLPDAPASSLSTGALTFVPNASQHLTSAARRALPSTRTLTPDQAIASGGQIHARLRQTPFFPEGHDAAFMLDELFQRPLAAGEVVIGAGEEGGLSHGLLRAGAVLHPGIGIDRKSINIQQMLAYPPRQGGGTALIQCAVNHAQAQGCDGVLRLQSLSEEDNKFYEKLGFDQVGPWHILVPGDKPTKWGRDVSDQWQFIG